MQIVVIDASLTVRLKIKELLLNMNSDELDIQLYDDARDALEFIRDNGADLIFSSIETEGLDGISFVDILLTDTPKYVSKLFIVTSQNHNETIEEIKGVGAKRFIKKPINDEYFKHFIIPEIEKSLKS
ncbi:MAG: response regulator [Campylobacterota bacterium]|nr:response regulator [Campylobacterota bacterium]